MKKVLMVVVLISEFIRSILAGVELAVLIQHPAGAGCHTTPSCLSTGSFGMSQLLGGNKQKLSKFLFQLPCHWEGDKP